MLCVCVCECEPVCMHACMQIELYTFSPSFRGRDRFVNEEFDLDLTYITERIIAMSFPATGMESTYRNSLKDVAKMLKTKHQENYMVCSRCAIYIVLCCVMCALHVHRYIYYICTLLLCTFMYIYMYMYNVT